MRISDWSSDVCSSDLPLLGLTGGQVPIAPVDYVAKAMDYIAHKPGLDGKCFCLIQSQSPTVGELMQTIMEAAHGPNFAKELEVPPIPPQVKMLGERVAGAIPPMIKKRLSNAIGIPVSVLGYIVNRAVFEDRKSTRLN